MPRAPEYDRKLRLLREKRIREKRRAKLWRRLQIVSSWLLLAIMAGLLGTGAWLMLAQ